MRTPAETMGLLARETRLREGRLPKQLDGQDIPADSWLFAQGQFVQRTSTGFAFHYCPGEGVVMEKSASADPDEIELWLNGSVYAAVACLNGLYPVHASAVAHAGLVHAFTGPSGAGKSTLVAGLGGRGLPLFCDDTLLLDLADPARIMALPGHKRLKLTEQGMALSGSAALSPVGAATGKSYALPPGGDLREPLPLASLTFLESGESAAADPILGAQKFARLADDHYTLDFYRDALTPSFDDLFGLRARLAAGLVMTRLIRPFSPEGFAMSLDLAEAAIRSFGTEEEA